jgi:hypothetical protein
MSWTVRRSSPGSDEVFHIRLNCPYGPPASYTVRIRSLSGVKRQGVALATNPRLALKLKKE